jgi:hypothetical protein
MQTSLAFLHSVKQRRLVMRHHAWIRTRQEAVNGDSVSLQTQEREAVVMPLPVSMHAGQIFLLTKLLTASDLGFYDFEAGAPVERWHSDPSGSS